MMKSSKPCVVSPLVESTTTKKVPEEVKLGMSDCTDSDSEPKENDDFQLPKKRQKVPAY